MNEDQRVDAEMENGVKRLPGLARTAYLKYLGRK